MVGRSQSLPDKAQIWIAIPNLHNLSMEGSDNMESGFVTP